MIRQKVANVTIPHPHQRITTGVRVDLFLLAMLKYAVGDSGKRYAACTILATKNRDKSLEDVALTWLHNMIFPSQSRASSWKPHLTAASKRTPTPSDSQTPTFDQTAVLIEKASRGGQAALRELVGIAILKGDNLIPPASPS